MRILISLLLLACSFSGCKQYTLDNLPEVRLQFGSAGGITGGERVYVLLLDSGKLLFHDEYSDGPKMEKVGRFTKEELAAIKADLERMSFSEKGSAPRNYNTSLAYHHGGRVDHLSWSQPGGAPTPELKACYSHLMKAVRRLRKAE